MYDINFSDLLTAIALVFIFEGLMPFLNPDGLRKVFQVVAQLDNQKLRFLGIIILVNNEFLISGLNLLYVSFTILAAFFYAVNANILKYKLPDISAIAIIAMSFSRRLMFLIPADERGGSPDHVP